MSSGLFWGPKTMGRTHDETDKGCDEQRLLIDLKVLSIGFLLIDLKGLFKGVFFSTYKP